MLDDKAVLFISHLFPKEIYDEVISNSKNNMQDAANALQWHLVDGFCHNLNRQFDIINFMPIASYPKYYKKAWIAGSRFLTEARSAYNIGFCNIKAVRRLSIAKNLRNRVNCWCRENIDKEKVVILYTLNGIALDVLSQMKKKYNNITVCAIVADLPNMINLSIEKGLVKKLSNSITSKSAYSKIDVVGKFVFLTKHMSDYLGNKKPFCVMEGIATDDFSDITVANNEFDPQLKTVLYTGTLHRRFGILHLLEAFSLIDNPNYRLIICGSGDSEREIKDAAKIDPRIVFKGQCKRDEALRLQRSATVLVNPRMNNEEFTKYSFPSKNIEYLSSGTPLIAYKLDGIPDEYDEFINYPGDNSSKSLANLICNICEMSNEDRSLMGYNGRQFVVNSKNCITQAKKNN